LPWRGEKKNSKLGLGTRFFSPGLLGSASGAGLKNPPLRPRDEITIFSRRAEKAKYLTKSSEVMRNFAGEKKKHSSTRAE
jgi:hypothetical protein